SPYGRGRPFRVTLDICTSFDTKINHPNSLPVLTFIISTPLCELSQTTYCISQALVLPSFFLLFLCGSKKLRSQPKTTFPHQHISTSAHQPHQQISTSAHQPISISPQC
ncbi:MAG: hypothetical protein WCD66_01930, partial [Rhodanobacteraceae bacterium]